MFPRKLTKPQNMAAPAKKRNINSVDKKLLRDSRKESHDEDGQVQKIIHVEFEGRNPTDSDFHGIKQLLHQLFLKSHLNVNELTEVIIRQNYIGSVIKQCEAEDETDEEDSDPNEVYGITTVINLIEKQQFQCISQLTALILKFCKEHGSQDLISFVENLMVDKKPVGLLINERFVNIPPQISVPLFKSLRAELQRAVEKKMGYDFSYLILISKLYKMDDHKKTTKKQKKNDIDLLWSNPEEEIIDQEVERKFEFSVKDEADSGLIGDWDENDDEMIPMRRILFIPFHKLDTIITRVEESLSA